MSPAEMAAKTAPEASKPVQTQLTGNEEKVVNLVNQKLRNYSRPVFLAVVIQSFVAVVFVILLVIFMADCPVIQDGPLAVAPFGEIKLMAEEKAFSCLRSTFYFSTEMKADITGVMLTLKACNPGDIGTIGTEWCTDDNIRNLNAEMFEACPSTNPHGEAPGDLYGFYFDQRVCRSFGDALGLALAYTTYVEIIGTIVIITILTKTGAVTNVGRESLTSIIGETMKDSINREDVKKMIEENNEKQAKLANGNTLL